MASHHFVGSGIISLQLKAAAADPPALLARVAEHIEASGLEPVARQAVPFPGGGLTLVWVLAESHLVLHHWAAEGYATIDLHVCDFRDSNAARARDLVRRLGELCFVPGSDRWQELEVSAPALERV